MGASKPDRQADLSRAVTFDSARGADGKVRAGVWDRVCVPGHDEKDGQSTDFDQTTLSQMVDNFVDRGDQIPIDHNHQSNYAATNGKPAPALGWYGALAVVWGGAVVKAGSARGVKVTGGEPGLDLSRDGLWAYRCEVTEIGDELLPNFKLLSPTFTTEGTKRDGTPVGYQLAAVAATNTPWQSGTEITFNLPARPAQPQGADMKKLALLAAHLTSKYGIRFEAGADDKAVKEAAFSKMEDEAATAMGADEKYDYEGAAKAFEDMARLYEDAHMDADGDDDAPPHQTMRRMAAKFRKMGKPADGAAAMSKLADDEEKAKMAKLADDEEKAKMAKLEADKKGDDAKYAVMAASSEAMKNRLAVLEAEAAARKASETAEKEKVFEALADQAIAGGYPKEARAALVTFARQDVEAARKMVAPHLKSPSGAPAHIFERLSPKADRSFGSGRAEPRLVKSALGTVVEDDGEFAEKIREVAFSTDPATKAKVDKLIGRAAIPKEAVEFTRLQAADKIVRMEMPDLVPHEDR